MNHNSLRRSLGRSSIAVATLAAALSAWPAYAQEAPPAPAPAPAAVVAPPASSAAAPGVPAPAQPAAPAPAPAQPAARRKEDETPAPVPAPAAKPGIGDRVRAFMNTSGIAGLQAQISTLTGERDQLRAQVNALTMERDQLRGQLGEVESALDARVNNVRAQAAEIASTTGFPQASLPAPVAPEAAKGSLEDLQAQLKTETDSNKRAELSAQIIALSK